MVTIKRLPEFDEWLDSLRDRTTRIRLAVRLDKVQRGMLGDVKPVGDGIYEMREFFGPGWRMYYVQQGAVLIVMLVFMVGRGRQGQPDWRYCSRQKTRYEPRFQGVNHAKKSQCRRAARVRFGRAT